MWKVQVHKREVWLLLLSIIIHTAQLRKSEISPGRIHHISGSHLWFLSQVSVYHCKLKFIEQYWGAAKLIYKTVRTSLKMKDMKEMEDTSRTHLMTCQLSKSNGEFLFLRLLIMVDNQSYQLFESRCPVYQCIWPRFKWSRNGPQSWKMSMRRDMMHRPIL